MNKTSYKLAHYISSCNICSRREGEKYILAGKVTVNNNLETNPAVRVTDNDIIAINHQIIKRINQARLYAYYKPVETLVTQYSQDDKITIFELVESQIGHVFAVGRLDYMSEGLLLLTNSNELCSQLMHSNMARIYKVLIDSYLTKEEIDFITHDYIIDNIHYKAWKIHNMHNSWITLELTEGKNREIRRTFDFLNINIKRLIRVQYGPYKIQGQPNDIFEIDI